MSEEDLRISEPFENVWDAIEDDPVERERLKMMSNLMDIIESHMERQGWTQKEAARHFGVTQPRMSDLRRGKMHLFSIDSLVSMLNAAGLRVEITTVRDSTRDAA